MPPQTPESGRIRPDHEQMRPTKKPRLAEAEESEAAEAQGSKAAEAQGQKAAEAQVPEAAVEQGPEAAVEQGPEADDPDEKYWSDSGMLNFFFRQKFNFILKFLSSKLVFICFLVYVIKFCLI